MYLAEISNVTIDGHQFHQHEWTYGCPVGELMASEMSPARKSTVNNIKKLMLKLSAAAPTIPKVMDVVSWYPR